MKMTQRFIVCLLCILLVHTTLAQPCCNGPDFPVFDCDCTGQDIILDPSNSCNVEIIANSITIGSFNPQVFVGCALITTQNIEIYLDDGDITIVNSTMDVGGNIRIFASSVLTGPIVSIDSSTLSGYSQLDIEVFAFNDEAIQFNDVQFSPAPISSAYVYAQSNTVSADIITLNSTIGSMTFSNFTFEVLGTNNPLSGIRFIGNNLITDESNFNIDISAAPNLGYGIVFDNLPSIFFDNATVNITVDAPIGVQMSSQFIIQQSDISIQCNCSVSCIEFYSTSSIISDSVVVIYGLISTSSGSIPITGIKSNIDFEIAIIRSIVEIQIDI